MKKLWIFLIPIIIMSCNGHSKDADTDSDTALTQTVFSVEKISKEEYIQAYNTSDDYNIYPRGVDSIAQYDVLNRIFQDARVHIADLDSIDRCAIYEAVTDDELYCVNNLVYYPDWNLLGFKVPMDYHNDTVWWYDSTTGKLTDTTPFEPTAVNTNGIYVCQPCDDCDTRLDLRFFLKQGNKAYRIQSYTNENFSGEHVMLMSEEGYKHIFWSKNNLLYLCSYDIGKNEIVFLRISLVFES